MGKDDISNSYRQSCRQQGGPLFDHVDAVAVCPHYKG